MLPVNDKSIRWTRDATQFNVVPPIGNNWNELAWLVVACIYLHWIQTGIHCLEMLRCSLRQPSIQ